MLLPTRRLWTQLRSGDSSRWVWLIPGAVVWVTSARFFFWWPIVSLETALCLIAFLSLLEYRTTWSWLLPLLGESALFTGRAQEAAVVFLCASHLVPPDDPAWGARIRGSLERLEWASVDLGARDHAGQLP